jgi:hypothetical protein
MTIRMRERWGLLLLVSSALFLAHAALVRDWADRRRRHLEGFSNPRWTLLLAGGLRTAAPERLSSPIPHGIVTSGG